MIGSTAELQEVVEKLVAPLIAGKPKIKYATVDMGIRPTKSSKPEVTLWRREPVFRDLPFWFSANKTLRDIETIIRESLDEVSEAIDFADCSFELRRLR